MANEVGHLLDADTIVLYKNRGRVDNNNAFTGPVVDETGTYPLTPSHQSQVGVTWGPAGSAQREIFSRCFPRVRSGTVRLLSGTIDQALIDANRADHTYEFLFKYDSQVGSQDYVFSIGGPASGSASLDWLFRLSRITDGRLLLWWEKFDADQQATTTSTTLTTDEQWHVAHITRTEDPSSAGNFFTSLYIDGVFAESWGVGASSYGLGTGAIPDVTSGTAAQIHIGNGGGSSFNTFHGNVGSARLITQVMSPAAIAAAAATLLADGTIAYDAPNTQFHYKFDDPPPWLDESPTGMHSPFAGGTGYFGSDPHKVLDFVNEPDLGGRARPIVNTNVHVAPYLNEYQTIDRHGKPLWEIFNDTGGVPTWTAEVWVLDIAIGAGATFMLVQYDGGGGESLATNVLAQAGFAAGTYLPYNLHEIGSGTNVVANGDNPLYDTAEGGQQQIAHMAVRSREDPLNAGMQLHEWFINGAHVSTVGPMSPPQGGTTSGHYLKFFSNGWDGWVQDFKLSAVARTDQEIWEDAHRIGPLGVVSGVAPALNSQGALAAMKAQYIASEDLRIVIPPFLKTTDNTFITTGDVVTLTIKKPDDTLLAPAPTAVRDGDTDFWVASVPKAQFQSGEWLVKAESDDPDALPQYRLLVWGDFLDDIFQATLGRWKIESNQLKLYKDDGLTVLRTFDLLDSGGQPSATQVFERSPT